MGQGPGVLGVLGSPSLRGPAHQVRLSGQGWVGRLVGPGQVGKAGWAMLGGQGWVGTVGWARLGDASIHPTAVLRCTRLLAIFLSQDFTVHWISLYSISVSCPQRDLMC